MTIQVFTTNQFNSLSTEAHVWDYDIYYSICKCLAPSGAWPSTSTTLHYNDVITSAIASQITSRPHDCLLNRLFKRKSKKTSKLHVTGLCEGNSPVTGEFAPQRASNAENVSYLMTSSCNKAFYLIECRFLVYKDTELCPCQTQYRSDLFSF